MIDSSSYDSLKEENTRLKVELARTKAELRQYHAVFGLQIQVDQYDFQTSPARRKRRASTVLETQEDQRSKFVVLPEKHTQRLTSSSTSREEPISGLVPFQTQTISADQSRKGPSKRPRWQRNADKFVRRIEHLDKQKELWRKQDSHQVIAEIIFFRHETSPTKQLTFSRVTTVEELIISFETYTSKCYEHNEWYKLQEHINVARQIIGAAISHVIRCHLRERNIAYDPQRLDHAMSKMLSKKEISSGYILKLSYAMKMILKLTMELYEDGWNDALNLPFLVGMWLTEYLPIQQTKCAYSYLMTEIKKIIKTIEKGEQTRKMPVFFIPAIVAAILSNVSLNEGSGIGRVEVLQYLDYSKEYSRSGSVTAVFDYYESFAKGTVPTDPVVQLLEDETRKQLSVARRCSLNPRNVLSGTTASQQHDSHSQSRLGGASGQNQHARDDNGHVDNGLSIDEMSWNPASQLSFDHSTAFDHEQTNNMPTPFDHSAALLYNASPSSELMLFDHNTLLCNASIATPVDHNAIFNLFLHSDCSAGNAYSCAPTTA